MTSITMSCNKAEDHTTDSSTESLWQKILQWLREHKQNFIGIGEMAIRTFGRYLSVKTFLAYATPLGGFLAALEIFCGVYELVCWLFG